MNSITFSIIFIFLFSLNPILFAEPTISPNIYFARQKTKNHSAKTSHVQHIPVTIRFHDTPSNQLLAFMEQHGTEFKRFNGKILHTQTIYPAILHPDSLPSLSHIPDILRIEGEFKPSTSPTLNISNPQVQAEQTWNTRGLDGNYVDGTGVIVTNVDTGIDIYHPAFFKPDGGTYNWIDSNNSGEFENGDAVDINNDGIAGPLETLRFFDAKFNDSYGLMEYSDGTYEADIDWLYHDSNRNNSRDYGPLGGYTDNSLSFGELLFIANDINDNNRLDTFETLTALGTSRIVAIYDSNGEHYRGTNLFTSIGDYTNHGTPSSGIVGGQTPGRRLVGMAPGAEFIAINRTGLADNSEELDDSVSYGLLWARELGSQIMMYEYGSWVYEFLDGSSNIEILINELFDDGIHQFTASGNLAGPQRKKHALIGLDDNETVTLPFRIPNMNIKEVYISILWRGSINSPDISITRNSSSIALSSRSISLNHINEDSLGDLSIMWGTDLSDRSTVKLDMYISSETPISGDIQFTITGNRRAGTTLDAYISDNVSVWIGGAQFTEFLSDDGTITSPGTAEKGVTVGAYDPRGNRNIEGDINDFSSWGETIDGRRAVDIVAPGSDVYSISSHYGQSEFIGGYLAFGGTSSSLPHVTGCAALIVSATPLISPTELQNILYNGALADNFTGSVPNDVWGFGKLRVFDSLNNAGLIVGVADEHDTIPSTMQVSSAYPNPFNGTTSFDILLPEKQHETLMISVYSLSGQCVFTHTPPVPGHRTIHFTWNGTDNSGAAVSSGIYLFQFQSGVASSFRKALFIK